MPETKEKPGQIFSLITKVMSEIGAIEKKRNNQQQNYKFRGIDDVYAALHDPLVAAGVFYVPKVVSKEVTERQSRGGGVLIYTTLLMEFEFYAPDGSSIVVGPMAGEGMDSSDKSANKAMSGALKNAILQLFCIPTEEPKDSENDSPEPAAKQPAARHQVKPGGQPSTNGDYTDLPKFRSAILDAFKGRGFNTQQCSKAIGYMLSKREMTELAQIPVEARAQTVAAIREGKCDGLKVMKASEVKQPTKAA